MAQFNLDDYELVEDRIRKFYETHPDGRIVAEPIATAEEREKGYFVVLAQVFENSADQMAQLPKATGLAFEIEGGPGANKTAALENAETSAIGRALANADYAKKGKRPSATEMEKVARGPQAQIIQPVPESVVTSILEAVSLSVLHTIWEDSVKAGYSDEVQSIVTKRKAHLESLHQENEANRNA